MLPDFLETHGSVPLSLVPLTLINGIRDVLIVRSENFSDEIKDSLG